MSEESGWLSRVREINNDRREAGGKEGQKVMKSEKRREINGKVMLPHTLEVSSVSLFSPHHNPHSAPLCYIQWFDHPWDLIHETDGSSNVVQHLDISHLQ